MDELQKVKSDLDEVKKTFETNEKVIKQIKLKGSNNPELPRLLSIQNALSAKIMTLQSKLKKILQNTYSQLYKSDSVIDAKENEIKEKLKRIENQKELIERKKNLVITRERALELSQEKNVYKQNVIYTLISVVIAIIMFIILGFMLMKRRN
jgi:ElaB/YqjD/DUF883 family membrane-anchored ribosome-binding protein